MESLSPTSSPAVSPASLFPWLENNEDKTITVTSGRKCYGLYQNYTRLGSLVKTCLGSSAWHSTAACLTWKIKVTPSNRLLFQLAPSMPHTEGIESGLLHTPTAKGNQLAPSMNSRWLMPTLTARDYKGGRKPETLARNQRKPGNSLPDKIYHQEGLTGPLNPQYCEQLMGYPTGWTELRD